MKHVITMSVENRRGVLARIVGLISGRGFNIESLNVAPTNDPSVSKITMSMPGDERVLGQITKQLDKLIDIIRVTDLTQKRYVNRELVLVEVAAPDHRMRAELADTASLFGAKVVSVQPESLTIQLVDEDSRIEDFLALLQPFKILDLSRSGVVAVAQGDQKQHANPQRETEGL